VKILRETVIGQSLTEMELGVRPKRMPETDETGECFDKQTPETEETGERFNKQAGTGDGGNRDGPVPQADAGNGGDRRAL